MPDQKGERRESELSVTPATVELAVKSVMEFFPYAWGSEARGISREEAAQLTKDMLRAMGIQIATL